MSMGGIRHYHLVKLFNEIFNHLVGNVMKARFYLVRAGAASRISDSASLTSVVQAIIVWSSFPDHCFGLFAMFVFIASIVSSGVSPLKVTHPAATISVGLLGC